MERERERGGGREGGREGGRGYNEIGGGWVTMQ